MRSLWGHWLQISRELEQAPHLLLLFDFDGTLAPIVERPLEAQILPEARRAVQGLARQSGCTLGFVSGRTLADLKKRVGVLGSFYAGNYGLEWEGPGVGRVRAPVAEQVRASLRGVKKRVSIQLGQLAGVWVEDKGLSLSIHYRRVPPPRMGEVRDWLARLALNLDHQLEGHLGKMVLEVRPAGGPDKSQMVRAISDSVERRWGVTPLLFYFGDDVGDEPAFAVASRKGYAVRVGRPTRASHARYYLAAPDEVAQFLQRVASCLARQRPSGARRGRQARRKPGDVKTSRG